MKRLKTALIVLCVLLPLASLIYKTQFLGLRLIPKKATTFWKVEMSLNWENIYRVDSQEIEPPYVLPVPKSLPSQEVMNVTINGKPISPDSEEESSPSLLQFGKEGGATRTTSLHFDVNTEFYDFINARDRSVRLDYEDRMRYLSMDNFDEETLGLLKKLSDTLVFHSDTTETKLEKFFFYLADEIVLKAEPHTVKDVIDLASGSYLAQAQTLMGLSRLNGIPARIAFGIQILDTKAGEKIYTRMFFTEAFIEGQWIPLFPEKRLMGKVTGNQIILNRDTENFASFLERRDLIGILLDPVKFDPMSSKEQLQSLSELSSFWSIFSLHRFSLSIQSIFLGIVLIPFGTVVLSFARVFVGINTFGIFMPILLTLFFLETSFVFGFSFLFLVVIVGLMQRALLDKFYLLAVPRLSILLAVVILLYILFAIAADSFGILAVNNKTLNYFPIVIITVFIERFSIYYIEEGASNTLKTSLGTFVVAALCYYLLAFKWLKVFLFNNPEMLLLAVGLNLMIGSYRGYRLFELFRFAQLKEDEDGVFS